MTLVTFIIPVRHQDNARDWSLLKANLDQTIASVSNQTNDDWRVYNKRATIQRAIRSVLMQISRSQSLMTEAQEVRTPAEAQLYNSLFPCEVL